MRSSKTECRSAGGRSSLGPGQRLGTDPCGDGLHLAAHDERAADLELARRDPRAICVGLHPGTVDTGLSAPFQGGVPVDRLFTPDFAAARLLEVVDRLKPDDSGKVFAWDGQMIPP